MSALCKIFSEASGPFEESSLKDFYTVLITYLNMKNLTNAQLTLVFKYIPKLLSSTNTLYHFILHPNIFKRIFLYINKIRQTKEILDDYKVRRSMNQTLANMLPYQLDSDQMIDEKTTKNDFQKVIENMLTLCKENYENLSKRNVERPNDKSTVLILNESCLIYKSTWNLMLWFLFSNRLTEFFKFLNLNDKSNSTSVINLFLELME